MNETVPQPVVKPKRQLTEAQKAALKKGREALAEKRRAALQTESNQLVQVEDSRVIKVDDELFHQTVQETCTGLAIVLASYFITFIVCQQL